jgi:oligoribonuclease
VYYAAPAKHGGHRALADILESVRELDYYRATVFSPLPGPTSDEAQAAATKVTADFSA